MCTIWANFFLQMICFVWLVVFCLVGFFTIDSVTYFLQVLFCVLQGAVESRKLELFPYRLEILKS